jgi:hypothetical protein
VFGIYPNLSSVENATDALVKAGFPTSGISVLLPQSLGGSKNTGTQKDMKTPKKDATTGGIIGAGLGVLAGVGILDIPGLGSFIAAGPIVARLAGLGDREAVSRFTGALIDMGIPEFEAKRYGGRLKKGGVLLSVHGDTSEEIQRAKKVVHRTGGEDVFAAEESSVDTKTPIRELASAASSGKH